MGKKALGMLGSSLRNAVKRRDHKERDQPAFRKKRYASPSPAPLSTSQHA
jgi:hypothetical protein